MLFVYPTLFHEEDKAFWVEFPDLPGCQSFGDTLSQTMEESQEALSAYIITLLEDGTPLPDPSDVKTIQVSDSHSFVSLVSCSLSSDTTMKSVKKTLTIPAWLNDLACMKGINFSKVLQDAVLDKLRA